MTVDEHHFTEIKLKTEIENVAVGKSKHGYLVAASAGTHLDYLRVTFDPNRDEEGMLRIDHLGEGHRASNITALCLQEDTVVTAHQDGHLFFDDQDLSLSELQIKAVCSKAGLIFAVGEDGLLYEGTADLRSSLWKSRSVVSGFPLCSVAYNPLFSTAIVGTCVSVVCLVDVREEKPVARLPVVNSYHRFIAINHVDTLDHLVASSDDLGRVLLWDLRSASGPLYAQKHQNVGSLCFHPLQREHLLVTAAGKARLLMTSTGEELFQSSFACSKAFMSDALAVASSKNTLHAWRLTLQ